MDAVSTLREKTEEKHGFSFTKYSSFYFHPPAGQDQCVYCALEILYSTVARRLLERRGLVPTSPDSSSPL